MIIGFEDPDISVSREQRGQAFMDLAMYAMGCTRREKKIQATI